MRKPFNLFVLLGCLSAACLVDAVSAQTRRAAGRTAATTNQTQQQRQTRRASVKPTLPSTDTLTLIRRFNKLHVGTTTFAPWVMNGKNGQLIGFEIEVAKKLAEDLGVELKLHPVAFKEIIGDLVDRRFDIIVSGIYPTPQRALFVNFSDPYSKSKIEVIANRDKMKRSDEMKDFNKSDVTIGVVTGTVYETYAKDNFPTAKMVNYEAEDSMYVDLAAGKIDAAVASAPTPAFAMEQYKGKLYLPFREPLGSLSESFAIRRGDTDFLNYLNTWIRYQEETGWLAKQRKYWFESFNWVNQL